MAVITWNEQCGDTAFAVLDKMLGGAREYFQNDKTLALAQYECHNNTAILNLAGVYLTCSYEQAERCLNRLRAKLAETFQLTSNADKE